MLKIFLFIQLLTVKLIFAQSTTGYSNTTIGEKFLVGADFGLDFSPSSGFGLGLRAQKEVAPKTSIDGGLAMGSGERERNIFAGLTFNAFPDYANQPAVFLKAFVEFAEMDNDNFNLIGFSPIFSKGLSIVNREYHLFAALPVRYIMGSQHGKSSRVSMGLNVGTTTPLTEWNPDLLGLVEMNFNLRRSYNALVFGVAKLF